MAHSRRIAEQYDLYRDALFQTQITGYGSRSEGFVAELINAISRQLDKGA